MDYRQNEYRQALDGLRYTEEQKARLAAIVAAGAERKAAPRRSRPLRRMAILAAAAALALAVGAGATGVLGSAGDLLAGIWGGSPAQTEIIDQIGRPIGASDTDNGVTVTAEAIIGDAYDVSIVYSIAREDGAPVLPEGVDARQLSPVGLDTDLHTFGGSSGSAGFSVAEDGTLQYVATITSTQPINRAAVTADFRDLSIFDQEQEKLVPVVEGHWTFRFDLDYEDCSVALAQGGETFTQGGMTFTIDALTVSPIAIRAAYTVDQAAQWSDAPSGQMPDEDQRTMERFMENVELLVTKTDGTVLDLSSSGGSVSVKETTTECTKGGEFNEIIPLEDIESVSFGGVVFPLG